MIEILDKSRLIKKRTILTIIFILVFFTSTGYCVYDVTDNWAIALTNEPSVIVYWSFPADLHYAKSTVTIDWKTPNIVQCDPIGTCSWASTVQAGDRFKLNSSDTTRTIQSVDSNNQMTLLSSYPSNASKAAYRVDRKITYQVGYHTSNITDANWDSVAKVSFTNAASIFDLHDEDFPGPYVKISSLPLSTTYYIRVKSHYGGASYNLSNEVSVRTTGSTKSWSYTDYSAMTSDSWRNLSPSLPQGNIGQVPLGYDTKRDRLVTWGGHPYGGGFPRVNELYYYDIMGPNTWKAEDKNKSLISDDPIAGCMSEAAYDNANNVFILTGNSQEYQYVWRRADRSSTSQFGLRFWPYVYDFNTHTWQDMRAFGFREYMQNAFANGSEIYGEDEQVVFMYDPRDYSYARTMIYDYYTNTFTKFMGVSKAELGGNRCESGLVYDSRRKKYMIVGGMDINSAGRGKAFNDVWEWDYDASPRAQWIKVTGISNSDILPTLNVDGSTAVYDSIHDKIILFQYMGRGHEYPDSQIIATYVYDPGARLWSRRNDLPWSSPTLDRPNRPGDINAVFSKAHNVVLLTVGSECNKSSPGNCSQTYAYRYDSDIPSSVNLSPPTGLTLVTTSSSVQLSWGMVRGATLYRIYRTQSDSAYNLRFVNIGTVSPPTTSYKDSSGTPGKIYHYYVTAVNSMGSEASQSNRVRSQPRVIRNGYVAVTGSNTQKIYWETPPETHIVGYNIYRAEISFIAYPKDTDLADNQDMGRYSRYVVKGIKWPQYGDAARYKKLNRSLITSANYTDNVDLTIGNPPTPYYPYKIYAYRIKAVNSWGAESGWSPMFMTIPEPVKGVRVTSDATSYCISWTKSNRNEEGIQGYRVYASWKATGGMAELTTVPTTNNSWTVSKASDPDGGIQMFFITAVDSLGQEGIPSGGTWGDRKSWSNFYYKYYGGALPLPAPAPDITGPKPPYRPHVVNP